MVVVSSGFKGVVRARARGRQATPVMREDWQSRLSERTLLMRAPTGTTVEAKRALRLKMRAARDALTGDVRATAAKAVAALAAHPAFTAAIGRNLSGKTVAGYVAFGSELDPAPLMARLADAGARLALPRISGGNLAFHAYAIGDPLDTGPFGTREPLATSPRVAPDIILTPLVAFDHRGGRLGYGKGYYDRVFADFPAAERIGIAYSMQSVAEVPREAHDAALALILTEAGVIEVEPRM
jgi:5-formyltetrahydrofolate cyclo-ligase